jgi:DNA-binding response OmpR family regulator
VPSFPKGGGVLKKILVIDDDKELCREMQEILEDIDYSVCVAFDGESGVELLKKDAFDVVLLDFRLPGMNGLEVLKRSREYSPGSKVLIISGRPFESDLLNETLQVDEHAQIKRLADGILKKPFLVEEFLNAVERLCRAERDVLYKWPGRQ